MIIRVEHGREDGGEEYELSYSYYWVEEVDVEREIRVSYQCRPHGYAPEHLRIADLKPAGIPTYRVTPDGHWLELA